jgi:hypothetical protein
MGKGFQPDKEKLIISVTIILISIILIIGILFAGFNFPILSIFFIIILLPLIIRLYRKTWKSRH